MEETSDQLGTDITEETAEMVIMEETEETLQTQKGYIMAPTAGMVEILTADCTAVWEVQKERVDFWLETV